MSPPTATAADRRLVSRFAGLLLPWGMMVSGLAVAVSLDAGQPGNPWLVWTMLAFVSVGGAGFVWLLTRLLDTRSRLTADIREREAVTAALRDAEARFRQAFDDAPIGMALVGLDGRWLRVNERLCQITGRDADCLRGFRADEITHPDDVREDAGRRRRLLAGELATYEIEKRFARRDGELIWVLLSVSTVRDDDGQPLYLVEHVQDVTERRRFEADLTHLAHHDPLTGLFNRRRFEIELQREVLASERLDVPGTLLMLDLDNFKYVNDTLGHAAGDELVARVAAQIAGQLRRTDVLARLGGDEFAIISPGAGVAEASELAERVLESIRLNCSVLGDGRAIGVTASIGVAPIDCEHARSPEQLLIDADVAMYAAKAAGRARVSVRDTHESAPNELNETLTWVQRIRNALRNDLFVLYEQPILELSSGCIARHEILVRMLDDDGALVAPAAFLPVAERFGLIQEIDAWVVRNAIALIAEQELQGNDLELEVNISGASVTDPDLLALIESEIERRGIDPASLIFEITETSAIVNIPQARRFAERLAELGCGFALDDFGAGFGGFFYLKHLPFRTLKIDGEFVRGLADSRRDQIMVRAIARVAAELETQTVAEFVGDERTRDLLRSYGVDYAQGFGIGRPQPVRQTWPQVPASSPGEGIPADDARLVGAPAV